MGCTRMARHSGTAMASTTITSVPATARISAAGSCVVIPKTMLPTHREAPQHRPRAHQRKEFVRYQPHMRHHSLPAACERHIGTFKACHRFERAVFLPPVVKIEPCHTDAIRLRRGLAKLHHPLVIGKRQRLEQNGIDRAEDGRVRADAYRERQQCRDRKAGTLR